MIAITFLRFWDFMNFVGVSAAAVINVWAARRSFFDVRVRLYCTAFLAALYAVAYGVLLWTPIHVADWSNGVRGFGFITYIVVWIWPAVAVARTSKQADEELFSDERYNDPPTG